MKSHSFVTKIYESQITFDYKRLTLLLDKEDMDKALHMKTTFYKEKNILLESRFKFLLDSCQKFYEEVARDNNYISWIIMGSWIQRYDRGDFHGTHIHSASLNHWNFVFYLDCKEDSSKIIVLNPGYPYIDMDKRVRIKPKIGGCVAFPGYVPHCVEPNISDKRIVLSSNLAFSKKTT